MVVVPQIWSDSYMVFDDIEEKKTLSAQETIELVRDTTLRMLAELEFTPTHHITIRDLTDKVAAETEVQISIANGLCPVIARDWAKQGGHSVSLGRKGGIHFGGKKERVDNRPRCETCKQIFRGKV